MKKNRFVFGILFIVLGLLIAIGPHTLFPVCGPMENGKFMKCHWTAQAESGIGAAIAATGLLSILFESVALRIGIEQNRCAMACQGCGAVFSFLKIKSSGNQVLIVVLLSHHNQQSNRIDITTAYEKINT